MSTPEEVAAKHLSQNSLRDFGPPTLHAARDCALPSYRSTLLPDEAPVPVLLRYALTLIGIPHDGPGEKVAWWVTFTYKGYPCELAHQKFGLRLRIEGHITEKQAGDMLLEMQSKLVSAVKIVEHVLAATASDTLNAGNVTVVNQHQQLRRAYEYFRDRALSPGLVEDVHESGTNAGGGTWSSFRLGKQVMAMHAFYDLVAAISAFVSSLEHDLVLALPFHNFDPTADDLTKIIGNRWGEKWRRLVGHSDPEAVRLRERLTRVVERWRNPYSHGGFEKGQGATIYLHTPGLGALPVGLSGVRESPLFSFHPASDTDIKGVFALFDEIDAYLASTIHYAMAWIDSGLNVRFDAEFMAQVVGCIDSEGGLDKLIDSQAYYADMASNMDY